jgi:hypothetical protein
MVRATVAFAVVALGAAAVIAQASEGTSQLEARDFNNDLEVREYLEDVVDIDAREPEVFFEEIDAREPEPEFFDDIEAREYEAELLEARDFEQDLEARAPAPAAPSKTVTITANPSPTSCTKTQLKTQREQKKVDKALAVLRSGKTKSKKDLSRKERLEMKKARRYLRRVRSRRVRAANRTARKCRSALRKAGLSAKKCNTGTSCDSALTGKDISASKCTAANNYLQRMKTSRKARRSGSNSKKNLDKSKKSGMKSKRSRKLLASRTTSSVGADGVTTVTVNAGPTCTSGSSSKSKKLVRRDIVDEEFDSLFAREYEFDNLD